MTRWIILLLCLTCFVGQSVQSTVYLTNVIANGGNGTMLVAGPTYGQGLILTSKANFTHTITAFGLSASSLVRDGTNFIASLSIPECAVEYNGTTFELQLSCETYPISLYCTETTVISYDITATTYFTSLGTVNTVPAMFSAKASNMYQPVANTTSSRYIRLEVTSPEDLNGNNLNSYAVTLTNNGGSASEQVMENASDLMSLYIVPTDILLDNPCPTTADLQLHANMVSTMTTVLGSTQSWQFVPQGEDRDDSDNNLLPATSYSIFVDPGVTQKDITVSVYLDSLSVKSTGIAIWAACLWSVAALVFGIGAGFVLTIVAIIGLRHMNRKKAEEFDTEFAPDNGDMF